MKNTYFRNYLPVILSISALASLSPVFATPLSPDKALERVNKLAPAKLKSRQVAVSPTLYMTAKSDNTPGVYIFKGANRGFMVVSADDCSVPLLGYSDSAVLPESADDLPDNFRAWVEDLSEQVLHNADDDNVLIFSRYSDTPEDMTDVIEPMVTTRWNQNAPYNNLCPKVGTTSTYTGCVATAMAQIINYYKYPLQGQGTHSYTWQKTSSSTETLSFDYGATTFDYDKMLDNYAAATAVSDSQKEAVATLMYACGVAVDMMYGTSASGAYTNDLTRAYVENFGFDKDARYYMRAFYDNDEWDHLVYNQLKEYGPVQYSGANLSSGHSFVCDGYDGNGYFHFNWGWGGVSDGYFLLTALDPRSQGIGGSSSGYNFSQDIIGNLKPEQTTAEIYPEILSVNSLSVSPTSCNVGDKLSISSSVVNYSAGDLHNISLAICLTDSLDNKQIITAPVTETFARKSAYSMFSVSLPDSLADGTYDLTTGYVTADGTYYDTPFPLGYNNRYVVSVEDGACTLSAIGNAKVTVSDMRQVTPMHIGSKFKIGATLTNPTELEYTAYLTIVLIDPSTSSIHAYTDPVSVNVKPGEALDWEQVAIFYPEKSSLVAGKYYCYICKQNGYNFAALAQPISIELLDAAAPTVSVLDVRIDPNQDPDHFYAEVDVQCTEGYFYDTFKLGIAPAGNSRSYNYDTWFNSDYVSLDGTAALDNSEVSGGEVEEIRVRKLRATANTTTLEFSGKHTGVMMGQPYVATLFQGDNAISQPTYFEYGDIATSTKTIASDDIAQREYISLTGVNLGSNRPGAGIYIVRDHHSDGTITTSRQLVR